MNIPFHWPCLRAAAWRVLAITLLAAGTAHAAQESDPGAGPASPARELADRAFDARQYGAARRHYLADCEARGNGKSCSRYGLLLLQGWGGAQDDPGARRFMKRACDAGYARGCNNLGLMTQEGRGGPANATEAHRLYDHACALGWGVSCIVRGEQYWLDPARGHDARARPYFERACRLGAHAGCWAAGELAYWGEAGPADYAFAREAYALACTTEGSFQWEACSAAAVMAEEGKGGAVDPGSARRYYGLACGQGILYACNNLAVMEEIGSGGPENKTMALQRADNACAAGYSHACSTAALFRKHARERTELAHEIARDNAQAAPADADASWWQADTTRRTPGRQGAAGTGQGVSWAREQQRARPPKSNTCRWKTYEGYGGGRVCVQE